MKLFGQKFLKDLDSDQVKNSILIEIQDSKQALTDKTFDKDSFIEVDKDIKYFNRVLNTAVYDSLVTSGIFLSLSTEMQQDMADLYSRIKWRNRLLSEKLRDLEYARNMTPDHMSTELLTDINRGTTATMSRKENMYDVNISNVKKEIMEYEKDILGRLEDMIYDILEV
jgi:hypothetical protein